MAAIASRTRSLRFSLTVAVPLMTAETVATDTPASRATSCIVYLRFCLDIDSVNRSSGCPRRCFRREATR